MRARIVQSIGVASLGALLGIAAWWLCARPVQAVATYEVVSGSMAPLFHGPSHAVVCGDCQFAYRIDATSSNLSALARSQWSCPNCGFLQPSETPVEPGQRIQPLATAELNRWAVVAVSKSMADRGASLKRIVGLPTESISIDQGDVLVNDVIARKDWATMETLAITVHDDRYRPRHVSTAPWTRLRWRPAPAARGWSVTRNGYRWRSLAAAPSPLVGIDSPRNWLVYHHKETRFPLFPHGVAGAISDQYAYNADLSRTLQTVTDYFVEFWAWGRGDTRLTIDWQHGLLPATCEWRTSEKRMLIRCGETCDVVELMNDRDDAMRIVFGYWDRQLMLVIDGQTQWSRPVAEPGEAGCDGPQPIRVGADGTGEIEITDIRIARDIHYLHPLGLNERWDAPLSLGDSEYFLLGDNSPISIDGRHGHAAGIVDADAIIGKTATP